MLFRSVSKVKESAAPKLKGVVSKVKESAAPTVKSVISKVKGAKTVVAKPAYSKMNKSISKIKKTIGSKVKSVLPKINGLKVYGNFCGPNYCGGQKFKGAEGPKCQWGVPPKDSLDSCCKLHDQCCGTPSSRGVRCNQEILSCIKNVKCTGLGCNVAQTVMKETFSRLQNKVCGKVFGKSSVSKPVVVKATPAPVPVPAPATVLPIYMTCDNEFDLYVNGNKIGRGTSWTTTYNFSPLVKPGDVIAIDGVDQGGPRSEEHTSELQSH